MLKCYHKEKITYLSTPITGGSLLYNTLKNGFVVNKKIMREIVDANKERTIQSVGSLKTFGILEKYYIDPSQVGNMGWEQAEYHYFWSQVIEKFSNRIILLDGWEYSNGCSIEYKVGLELGIDVVDERGEDLKHKGLNLLRTSIKNWKNLNINYDTQILEDVLNSAERLVK